MSRYPVAIEEFHQTLLQLRGITEIESEVENLEGTLAIENWRNLYRSGKDTNPQPVPVDDVVSPLPILKQIIQILNGESVVIYDFYDGYNAQVILEALRKPGEGFTDIRPQLMGYKSQDCFSPWW
ncbi:hypothetical protein SAMN04488688_110119 [Paenibacillus sp. cl141a]|nr:hypothetical protein SAMN04488688_110119 [Paenibacillus sp. cl141a]